MAASQQLGIERMLPLFNALFKAEVALIQYGPAIAAAKREREAHHRDWVRFKATLDRFHELWNDRPARAERGSTCSLTELTDLHEETNHVMLAMCDAAMKWRDYPTYCRSGARDRVDRFGRRLQALERHLIAAESRDVSPKIPSAGSEATHSSDFTSVDWFGTRYTFAKGNQAESVRVLWAAWEGGGHSLSQETICKKIDSGGDRFQLAKVFRARKSGGGYEPHPVWGTMIQQDSKGSYCLVPPESS